MIEAFLWAAVTVVIAALASYLIGRHVGHKEASSKAANLAESFQKMLAELLYRLSVTQEKLEKIQQEQQSESPENHEASTPK